MVQKYAEEKFLHSFPFTLKKDDAVVSATVKAYTVRHPEIIQEVVITGARRVGVIQDSLTRVWELPTGSQARFVIQSTQPELVEQAGIIGAVTVVQTGANTWEVRAWLQNGSPGTKYLLRAKVVTRSGEELITTDTLTIKPETE